MTAAALGQKVGVSESTVVRFATELGFKGYPELQKELQQLIKSKLTAVQRMEVSENLIGDSDIITSVLNGDIELIRATAEKTSREAFKNAVSEINRAKRIYILGVRSSAALASFLAFYFNLVFDAVTLIDTASASEMFEQMFRIDEKDVCIAISFPRYSKQTVNALRFIADRGGENHRDYRYRKITDCVVCQPPFGRAQRYGVCRGFADRTFEPYKRLNCRRNAFPPQRSL